MLIIHLVSNDLVSTPIHTLLTQVEHDIKEIHGLMPDTVLVWSNVLLRLFWFGSNDPQKIERYRARINRKGRQVVIGHCNGRAIYHDEISYHRLDLFKFDGTHLNAKGNSIFLGNIKQALQSFVLQYI